MSAEIDWAAGDWHLVTMGYTPTNSVLFLDGQQVAVGDGLPTVPKEAFPFTSLVVGSTSSGARGQQPLLVALHGRRTSGDRGHEHVADHDRSGGGALASR